MSDNTKRPDITFYLYDYSNKLATKPKKIYSPFNTKTLGRTPTEDRYNNPDAVEFIGGEYVLSTEYLSDKLYDEQLEWLGFYNQRGGTLRKGTGDAEFMNGRRYKNDGIHVVRREQIQTGPKPTIKTIQTTINVPQIPKFIAEGMNVGQLESLALSWGIELPLDLKEKGNATAIKGIIIEIMTTNGNISDIPTGE